MSRACSETAHRHLSSLWALHTLNTTASATGDQHSVLWIWECWNLTSDWHNETSEHTGTSLRLWGHKWVTGKSQFSPSNVKIKLINWSFNALANSLCFKGHFQWCQIFYFILCSFKYQLVYFYLLLPNNFWHIISLKSNLLFIQKKWTWHSFLYLIGKHPKHYKWSSSFKCW